MTTVLLSIHLMIVIALVGLILVQKSEGGGLGIGGGGGGNSFMNARGTANLLTRATGILAAAFFFTSLALTVLNNPGSSGPSAFEGLETDGGEIDLLQGLQDLDRTPQPQSEDPLIPQSQ